MLFNMGHLLFQPIRTRLSFWRGVPRTSFCPQQDPKKLNTMLSIVGEEKRNQYYRACDGRQYACLPALSTESLAETPHDRQKAISICGKRDR